MYISDTKLLEEVILLRAFDYLANYRDMPPVHYLEIHGGAVITACIVTFGLAAVINKFERKIAELE